MHRRPIVKAAFDQARFGATRILNVRDPLLSGAEAVRRADGWIRAKQVERAEEVLVITGRGAGSPGQEPVVREAVRKLLGRLRRQGVVAEFREHTPGSFAVRLASLRAMFEAPPRTRDGGASRPSRRAARTPATLPGLEPETLALLRRLAIHSLDSLGIAAPDEAFIGNEMARKFSLLARAAGGQPSEDMLRTALHHALLEYEDGDA
ncbi:MAG TPA: Smr/MutS family protein [Gemmatimonadaceae bacterium]|nr:MAG: hypothetical protein ABS52_02190 [Gemmatimonadetes bacterium SCN 70-22]HMN07452.1 Smr/MutS family protein [Gemmatimonadaceae bacterium]